MLPKYEYTKMENIPSEVILETRESTKLEDGSIYEGEWNTLTNLRHGCGKQIWQNGSIFEGNLKDGAINGQGRFIYALGDVYEGEWKDDMANGFGCHTDCEGTKYEGNFFENM